MFSFEIGLKLLVPKVIALILRLGAMAVLIMAGCMSLTAQQQLYDVRGWYRARIEHLFRQL